MTSARSHRKTSARRLGRVRALAALVVLVAPFGAAAQVRHRRPLANAPNINYGFDNRAGAGCRDYTCGGRCYDGHTGTDIPVPLGTAVLASAAGTVIATNNGCANYGGLGNTCGGRCGNYVQLQHSDGTQTIYCHMQLNSLRVGRGQQVGCGHHLGNSASSGSSTGPHLHFGWRSGGASRDPFRGNCAGGGVWTQQTPYPQSPGDACDGPPPPPPPPPCTARVGPFGWNCSGPIEAMTCTQIHEGSDPHTWGDNYFCSDIDRGFRWSSAGPIAGMRCTQVTEGSEPAAHTWNDNYLCAPPGSGYTFRWSSAGPVAGMTCLPWYEPADPHTWEDNFLCWRYTAPAVDAGSPARDVPMSTDRGTPSTDLSAHDVPAEEDVNLPDDAPTVDVFTWDAGTAPGSDGGFDDLPPVEDVSIEPHLTEGEAGPDCGCAVPGRRGGRGAVWLVLPLWALVRRRRARGG